MSPGQSPVLLVEDDPVVRSALLGALEDARFEAVGVADAVEALGVLGQRRVAVVVADHHLPGGVSGLDLLAAIRGAAPGTPLILYSGGMTDELAERAWEFDVRAVLEKPVSAERLIKAVRARLVGVKIRDLPAWPPSWTAPLTRVDGRAPCSR